MASGGAGAAVVDFATWKSSRVRLQQVLRGLPRRPTVFMLQELTPPRNTDVASLNGYKAFFEKRGVLEATTSVAVRTGPRMNVGPVETHEFYTKAEVNTDECELITVVNP